MNLQSYSVLTGGGVPDPDGGVQQVGRGLLEQLVDGHLLQQAQVSQGRHGLDAARDDELLGVTEALLPNVARCYQM